jgi:UDP:flavonoid glycosyltransferase YjiC (YdhE family)
MSAAVVAGDFYKNGVAAAHRLGRRAILVTGKNPRNLPAPLPAGMMACGYAPFSKLFPRAAAIVHHGGIGTTGFAMRAGRPMLVVPFSHDNPDNAERLARLGVARTVRRAACSPDRLAAELARLLDDPEYSRRAAAIGERVRKEDGTKVACDALEEIGAACRNPVAPNK